MSDTPKTQASIPTSDLSQRSQQNVSTLGKVNAAIAAYAQAQAQQQTTQSQRPTQPPPKA